MEKHKILFVDQEENSRKIFLESLMDDRFTVLFSNSAKEAIDILNYNKIDILLTNQKLSDMTGINLTEYCKKSHPSVVRILISTYEELDVVVEAINDGLIFHFIVQPWETSHINKVLTQAIEFIEKQKMQRIIEIDPKEVEELKRSIGELNNDVINSLMAVIKVKDYELYKHCYNVSKLAVMLGKRMKLSDNSIKNIEIAGMLHDIGKVAIKDAILHKPQKLNNEEFGIMQEHPYKGYLIVKEIGSMNAIANIICQHHERIDGKGYPSGLKEKDILTESKIIAVADTYDALISNRIYRIGLDRDTALSIIRSEVGHYDSNIVDELILYCNKED